MMSEARSQEQLEHRLVQAGRSFAYPKPPDFAGAFMRQTRPARRQAPRWAFALAIVVIAIITLIAVPQVRAGLLEFLQIGAVRIETPATTPSQNEPEVNLVEVYGRLISISNLMGETSLAEAHLAVDYTLPVPGYPADLGEPDHVYLQQLEPGRTFVIMTWMQAEDSQNVDMAVYVIGPGVSITKGPVDEVQAVTVKGQPAAYIRGAHYLQVDGDYDYGVLVQAPALIWEAAGVTYRIEADLPVDELVRIAESMTDD